MSAEASSSTNAGANEPMVCAPELIVGFTVANPDFAQTLRTMRQERGGVCVKSALIGGYALSDTVASDPFWCTGSEGCWASEPERKVVPDRTDYPE